MGKDLKTKLILQCKETVGNDLSGRRPLNIAVIGPPGCGKSAFLNTIFASFKDREKACWREIAIMGNYGARNIQETSSLKIYPKQIYIDDKNNHVLMPTFLDINGLENKKSEINEEMLSIFFNGKIREGEDLSNVREHYDNKERDIHQLRQMYNKRSENAKVDRIIVVCSANHTLPLPIVLLNLIRETAKNRSREIPIYGVLTHADKQKSTNRQYIQRKEQFLYHLCLIDIRFKCIANYCGDTDPTRSRISTTLARLDIPVLELMTQVLYPRPGDQPTPYSKIYWIAVAIIIMLLAILLMKIKS